MPGCTPCNECTNYGEETACLSPLNLSFQNLLPMSVGLSWDVTVNAANHIVEYKAVTSSTWIVLAPIAAPTNSITIIGLTPDTEYDFRVSAECAWRSCYSLTVRKKTCL